MASITNTASTAPRRLMAIRKPGVRAPEGGFPALLRIAPLVLLTIGLLMPPEVRFRIIDQNIYAYRMVYLLLAPWCIYSLLKGAMRYHFMDLLVVAAVSWMTLSFVVLYGFAEGFPSGVAVALDVLLPYIIARLAVTNLQDFRRFLVVLAPIVFALAILLPFEAIFHNRFIRDASVATFGVVQEVPFDIADDTRMGMLRAMGSFSHPILAGLFFGQLLPLYWFSRIRGWPFYAGFASGVATFFTLSSAALFGLVLFLVLALYNYVRKVVSFLTWPILIAAVGGIMAVLHVVSQNGLLAVLIRLTFNPGTGYYRLLTWEYGSISVERHPWFGIGFEEFERLPWMHTSVDAFWLAIAMRNGLPPSILFGLATLIAIFVVARSASRSSGADQTTLTGLAITLAILFILGFTVTFYGGLLIWFSILLGIGATFGSVPTRSVAPNAAVRGRIERR